MISAALAVLESEAERNELSYIYEQNIKTFYSIAFSKLHNKHDSEDAIQDAFLAVAKNPSVLFSIPEGKRKSYINVIIRNKAYDILSKNSNTEKSQTEPDDIPFDESVSAEDIAISNISREQILDYIDTLSEPLRAVIYLRMHLGLKNSDIADVLGISEVAVKQRISRAMGKIKQFMEDMKNE